MPLLTGRRLLVTGVLTDHSIAFAVAAGAQREGAEVVLTGFGRSLRLTERIARRLPAPADVLELDVDDDAQLAALREALDARWGALDGVLHAIAYAPPDALGGAFLATPAASAERAFRTTAFSYKALAEALLPLLERGAHPALVALDFDATVAWPAYDFAGVAKAALESINRYLARDLGARGIRANLVSAGPLRTMAANAIPGFDELAGAWERQAPLGWDRGRDVVGRDPARLVARDALGRRVHEPPDVGLPLGRQRLLCARQPRDEQQDVRVAVDDEHHPAEGLPQLVARVAATVEVGRARDEHLGERLLDEAVDDRAPVGEVEVDVGARGEGPPRDPVHGQLLVAVLGQGLARGGEDRILRRVAGAQPARGLRVHANRLPHEREPFVQAMRSIAALMPPSSAP